MPWGCDIGSCYYVTALDIEVASFFFVNLKFSQSYLVRRSKSTKARHGQGPGWDGLVMERASFSLGRQAPARR